MFTFLRTVCVSVCTLSGFTKEENFCSEDLFLRVFVAFSSKILPYKEGCREKKKEEFVPPRLILGS